MASSFSSVSGIGTDTISTHGHPAFDAQDLWGGLPSCDLAPLTTFGTVALRERQHLAVTPQHAPTQPWRFLVTSPLPGAAVCRQILLDVQTAERALQTSNARGY